MRQKSMCLQTTAEVAPPIVANVVRAEKAMQNKETRKI
jgi:hypothetical protein